MKIVYQGPLAIREIWGRSFPRDVVIEVTDPDLLRKVRALEGFVEGGEILHAVEVEEIPTDWNNLHWKQKVKLAKDLTGLACANGSEADEVLAAHFEGNLNA